MRRLLILAGAFLAAIIVIAELATKGGRTTREPLALPLPQAVLIGPKVDVAALRGRPRS